MSLEEAFKIVIAVLLGMLSFIGSKIFTATMANTLAINKLSIEMEQLRKATDRISKIETDVLALAQRNETRGHHFKGNGK